MSVQQQGVYQYPSLPIDTKLAIERDFASWERFREPFRIDTRDLDTRVGRMRLIHNINEMSLNCDIAHPIYFSPERKIISKIKVFIKAKIIQVTRPFVKICLSRQIIFNQNTMAMALRVVHLEDKIKDLESRIDQLSRSQ